MMNTLTEEKYKLFKDVYANEGQKIAIDKLNNFLNSSRKTFVLTGNAGTGKTTILKRVIINSNIPCYGGTISHQAKNILGRSIGRDNVYTVASLLGIKLNEETGTFIQDPKNRPAIEYLKRGVLIIDECSMITKEILKDILDKCSFHVKIIFVGDNKQLPPIGQETGISPTFVCYKTDSDITELTEIMRFGDVISKVAYEISKGIINDCNLDRISIYNDKINEGVVFVREEEDALKQAIIDFKTNILSTKCITYNNHNNKNFQSVKNLNKKIREKLYPNAIEPITKGDLFTFYGPFMDDDDKVIAQNSESFQVLTFFKKQSTINVSVFSHKLKQRTFVRTYTEVYETQCLFEDNKILTLELNFDPQFKKDLETIAKTQDWQLFYGLQKYFPQIEYGYSCTCHKAQGSGYNNIYVFEDNITNSPQSKENIYRTFYTAVTRAKNKLTIQSLNNL